MNTVKNIIAKGGGDILTIAKNILDNPILEKSLKWAQQNAIHWKDRSNLNKNFVARKRTENGFILEKKDLDTIRILSKRPFKEWVVYSDILSELFGYECEGNDVFAYERGIIDARIFSPEWDKDGTLTRFFKSVVQIERVSYLKVERLDEKHINATILFEDETGEGEIIKNEKLITFDILEDKMRINKRNPIRGFHAGFDLDDDEKQAAFTKAMGNVFIAYSFFVGGLYEILNLTKATNHFVFDEVAVKTMRFFGEFNKLKRANTDYNNILCNSVISPLRNDEKLLKVFETFKKHQHEDGPFEPAIDFLNRLEVRVINERTWEGRTIIYDRTHPLDFIIRLLIFGVDELPRPDMLEIVVREKAIEMNITAKGEKNIYEMRHWHTEMLAVQSSFNPCVER